jgi:hypothetical protein
MTFSVHTATVRNFRESPRFFMSHLPLTPAHIVGNRAGAITRLRAGRFSMEFAQSAPAALERVAAAADFNIRLVINHQNKQVSCACLRAYECRRARQDDSKLSIFARFSLDLNGSPMLLHDDIVAEERPRPVPSPAGLVVKKGLNIFSFTLRGIPVPLSRTLISTRSPRLRVS